MNPDPCVSVVADTGAANFQVSFLAAPEALAALMEEFRLLGLPVGGGRWVEHCIERLRELREKERTLDNLLRLHGEMSDARQECRAHVHHARRMELETGAVGEAPEERLEPVELS